MRQTGADGSAGSSRSRPVRIASPKGRVSACRAVSIRQCDHARSIGRTTPIDVFFPALEGVGERGLDAPRHADYVARLAEIGVTWVLAPIGGRDLPSLRDAIAAYGEDVIRKAR